MERHVVVGVPTTDGPDAFFVTEQKGLESYERDDATHFLQQRFPLNCPHHLLHNLLNGHYSRHPFCDARPFHDEQCRHGSHSRPRLSAEEMQSTAPAAGVVIFLPFGLSYGTSSGEVSRLVAGCADCEFLDEGDACGGCRRVWHDGCAVPAQGFMGTDGQYASLATWRESVSLSGSGLPEGGGVDEEEGSGEDDWEDEDWGEEDWREEEEDGEDGDGEEDWAQEAGDGHVADQQNWDGHVSYVGYDGDQGATGWGDGHWAPDDYAGWSWIVDFPAAPPAPAVTADAPAPAEAAAAAVRILELELDVARLKQAALCKPTSS